MDKVIRFFPIVLFSAYFTKILISGAKFVDAPVLAIAALLIIAMEFKLRDKKLSQVSQQVKDMQSSQDEMKKEVEQLRSYVSSAKLNQLRVNTNAR